LAPTLSRQEIIGNHIEAMQHPLRREIWKALVERGLASPKEIADELDERTDLVSHHVKRLVKLGFAELAAEKRVRGAIAHYYRAIERPLIENDQWNQLLEENPMLAEHLIGRLVQAQLDDYERSLRAGILGADDEWYIGRIPAVVDRQGLQEAIELADRLETEVAEIERRSAERRSESGEDALPMAVSLGVIKMPARSSAPDESRQE
jgi:predicted transcriptional regulator